MSPQSVLPEADLEIAALDLLDELGWDTFDAYAEQFGAAGLLGRDNPGDVILVDRYLRPALELLNPDLPADAFAGAIDLLTADLSAFDLTRANQKVWSLVRDGIDVEVRDDETGRLERVRVRVVDWDDPARNSFVAVRQFWVTGEMYKRRADIIGFVNGLPLVFIELKASHRRLRTAFDENLTDYKDTIPQLFWPNGIVIVSNGSESRMGSVSAGWEHFGEWKRIDNESEPPRVSLETMLRSTCEPARLLDLVENFTVFSEVEGGVAKIVAKNHQYLGVNAAIESLVRQQTRESGAGRLGVFWHTQGSGKSLSMLFFCEKVHRKLAGNWTFVVVTDRDALDDQIYRNFHRCGVLTKDQVQAESIANLRTLLASDERYVFTLIQKFGTRQGEKPPVLTERSDVVVITDEAHRTQYDTLAYNMRVALPNASFLGFTGTPLIAGEEKTRETFGDYVSVYDFRESIADGATVPLYYENRIPELQLEATALSSGLDALLEEAELDDRAEHQLARRYGRQYHLITRKDRLEIVAGDIVDHFLGRGYSGKAMVVSIDKATAVRMYDLVRAKWQRRSEIIREQVGAAVDSDETAMLQDQLDYMTETDMAVVVSGEQNEVKRMAELGLDIAPHRKRLNDEGLEEKFKDPDDPFRIVFVCAMWITGFDAPSCSTIYVDKPMRNHALMQTIARANRVWQDKTAGTIVDYVGIFRNLQDALAIYATGAGEAVDVLPVEAKDQLRAALSSALDKTRQFLRTVRVDLDTIEDALREGAFAYLVARDDAIDAIKVNDATQREFLDQARYVDAVLRALLPAPGAGEIIETALLIRNIADAIRSRRKDNDDITALRERIAKILDGAVTALDYTADSDANWHVIDLADFDLDAITDEFETSKHKNTQADRLRNLIELKINRMVNTNPTRIDLLERFHHLVDDYNAGSKNIESLFADLIELSQQLDEEDQRAMREGLDEEELAVFDLLTRPDPASLTDEEQTQVKAAARDLLAKLKQDCLVLDWRRRERTRAAVKVAIKDVLDDELPDPYDTDIYETKCERVYQHVYDSYYGDGASVYDRAPEAGPRRQVVGNFDPAELDSGASGQFCRRTHLGRRQTLCPSEKRSRLGGDPPCPRPTSTIRYVHLAGEASRPALCTRPSRSRSSPPCSTRSKTATKRSTRRESTMSCSAPSNRTATRAASWRAPRFSLPASPKTSPARN